LRPAGLRRPEATLDCTVADGDGAPYLRYRNHKMKREALVPIDDELLALIHEQQQRVLSAYPAGTVLFPRPHSNPDGRKSAASSSYREALYQWLQDCDVRDEHGRPVHLTPHQWRYTLGTILKMGRIASDAAFPEKRDHGPAGDAGRARSRVPAPTGEKQQVRAHVNTGLRQPSQCCI